MPLLLQIGLGWSPLQAGLVLMGQAIGTLLAKAAVTTVIRRFRFRAVLTASCLAAGLVNMVPASFGVATSMGFAFLLMIATGLVRSMQFTINNTIAFADLRAGELAGASTLASVVQQVGHALGISFGGILLAGRAADHDALSLADFATPFVVVGLVGASAALFYGRLPASTGTHMRGRASAG